MEFFMKNLSIYSLLFVLIALNSLEMNADTPKTAMGVLKSVISDPKALISLGGSLGFGLYSLPFFYKYMKEWNKWDLANTISQKNKTSCEALSKFADRNAKLHLKNARSEAFKGFACLAGAGLVGSYFVYKTIQQARS
jgi:hypothetical protein